VVSNTIRSNKGGFGKKGTPKKAIDNVLAKMWIGGSKSDGLSSDWNKTSDNSLTHDGDEVSISKYELSD